MFCFWTILGPNLLSEKQQYYKNQNFCTNHIFRTIKQQIPRSQKKSQDSCKIKQKNPHFLGQKWT